MRTIKSALIGMAVWVLFQAPFGLAQYGREQPAMKRRGDFMREMQRTITLRENWFIQSSAKVQAAGEEISKPGFFTPNWYPASVPSTVLGTLVRNNVYTDIFTGENFKYIPKDDFKTSWWYRVEFMVGPASPETFVKLEFDGINYRANIWLNGQKVGDAAAVAGAFRRFEIEVKGIVKLGEKNALAVEVFPPQPGEFTIGFVDWNPKPPDGNMGLWRDVRLRASGDVAIVHPFVQSRVDAETLKEAEITLSAEVRNNTADKISGVLECRIEKSRFTQDVTLEPRETKKVVFGPDRYPQLKLKNPRLWWTHDLGKPELYDAMLTFAIPQKPGSAKPGTAPEKEKPKKPEKERDPGKTPGPPPGGKEGGPDEGMMIGPLGRVSDIKPIRFGVREVSDYTNEGGHRGFKLNGRKILIRGGGWTDDILLDNDLKKLRTQIRYARHMNLNALRLEGFWGTGEDLYDLCDENGILLMAGWSCHWEWENYVGKPVDKKYGGVLTPEDIRLIAQSWKDQVKWLRNHPSILVWLEASDLLPKPELEKEYQKILAEEDPSRPVLVSAKSHVSELTGKSGVKMNGPYDYVPPHYWYVDKDNGGAFGFNTETGPGPQVPPLESVKKMIPERDLWPINDVWKFHCCRGEFDNLDRYTEAMTKRLGPPQSAADYCAKAQFLNYEGMRAMFEAFIANRYQATGIIQWMFNSAWPKLWWQLFDYYLMPTGAFYGARKAGEPVHLFYNYGTREILAVNNTVNPADKLQAAVKVFNLDLQEKFSLTVPLSLSPDEKKPLVTIPDIEGLSAVYFVDLRILDEAKMLVSANFYALPAKPDVLDPAKTTWYVTPVKEYADLTALASLPGVELRVKSKFSRKIDGQIVSVELENPTKNLAFMVELSVIKKDYGESVLPIFWDDNYLCLLPGETRKIEGAFLTDDLAGFEPEVRVVGWNAREAGGR